MRAPIPLRERIIVALDVPDLASAASLVERLDNQIGFFKVGLQLFLAEGFRVVDHLTGLGHKVMLDLKFHDIPQTVKLAVDQLKGRGVALATLHAERTMMAAATSLPPSPARPDLLAVTVLTSMSQEDLAATGVTMPVDELVRSRAAQARDAGMAGAVCSPREAAMLRGLLGPGFLLVTPGVRPASQAGTDDQKRTLTPAQAIAAGADHLVIGRPITKADNPAKAAEGILREIAEG